MGQSDRPSSPGSSFRGATTGLIDKLVSKNISIEAAAAVGIDPQEIFHGFSVGDDRVVSWFSKDFFL